MDASLSGWGGVLGSTSALDRCTPKEAWLPINVLVLGAIGLSVEHLSDILRGLPVRRQLDNITAVAYVNHQGETSIATAALEASRILR